jgi:hypothetical protein
MAGPSSTAGAPARAPGERPTNKARRSRIGAARCNHRDRSLALLSCCSGEAPARAPGERPTLETRGGGFTAGEALGRAQTVSAMAGPCSTAGAPAQAPGERPTLETRGGGFTAGEALGRARRVSAMAGPCSTAGAPAQAPGDFEARPQAAGDIGKISGEPGGIFPPGRKRPGILGRSRTSLRRYLRAVGSF